MKRFGRFLCLIIAAAMTASLICSGASAAFVRPGATDGAGGVANAVEDFLHGRLNDPSAGQVASDILNVVSNIDLEHMESVVADKLVNYDYVTASQLLGNGVIAVTGKEAQRISDLANGRMPHDTQAMSETRYFWVFMNDKSFYTSDSDNLVLQTAQGALVHMIGVTMAGKFVELYARTDALGMATFDNVPYGQYFCGASYTDPKTGCNYETETMSEHVWVPASGKLQNLTMTRVDALSNSYLDQIKRELISGGYDVNDKYSAPAGSSASSAGKTGSSGASAVISDENTPLASGTFFDFSRPVHPAYATGRGASSFEPRGTLTRAEAAQMLYVLISDEAKSTYGTTSNSFSDVPAGKWYTAAVSTLSNAGVITGYPDGTFRPDKQITRAELTAIVVSMFGKDDSAVSPFSDVSRSQWYYGYVATAAKNGWVKGYSGNTFHPVSNITRAEAVTFINGALNRSFDADYGASHYMYLKHFSDVKTTDWFYGQVMEASYGHEYAVSDSGSEVWIGPY